MLRLEINRGSHGSLYMHMHDFGWRVARLPLVPAATNAGARVVDLYSAIAMDVTEWISPYDGLHPTQGGYQEIALVWFNAIRSAFELPLTSTVTTGAKARPGTVIRRGFRR